MLRAVFQRAWLPALFFLACGNSPGAPQEAANSFVDSKVCGACHSAILQTYRRTGMARSFYRAHADDGPENLARGLPFHHAPTGAYYSMTVRGGQIYQSRWQAGPGGEKINRAEWSVDYIMGSGNHVRTYLHRNANRTLVELPLAWYAEKGGSWGMNPGFDSGHFVAPRKIAYECMFCHNAYPKVPAGHEKEKSVPAYLEPLPEGIDCQRCHGPGANHVRLAQLRGANAEEIRNAIVNPARLSADRQMEVCMQCHLQTTSLPLPAQIRRFGRAPFSYRAGEPLDRFALFFARGSEPPGSERFEIASSVTRLRESQCFLKSKGALTCLTCHDPHDIPRGEAASKHYNAVCRTCHTGAFESLVASGKHTAQSGCIDCHMPKRRTGDVVHAVMTDHRIQRVKPAGDLLAPLTETAQTPQNGYRGPVVPYYPSSLSSAEDRAYLALAQVADGSNQAAGVAQLSAEVAALHPRAAGFYVELGDALRTAGKDASAVAAYQQAIEQDAGSAWALRRFADGLIATGAKTRAVEVLNRSIAAAPDDARTWYALAELDLTLGRKTAAIAAFQKAAALDSESPDPWNALGALLADSGRLTEAQNAFETALRVQPDLVDAQANLGMLLASKGDIPGAAFHLEQAVKASPTNVAARCNYAIALAQMNRPQEAEQQLNLALQTDPNYPQAHLDLAMLLGNRGDMAGAAEHLRKAAAGNNPAVRQKARDLLQQIK